MFELLVEYQDIIILVAIGVAGFFIMGKEKATKILLEALGESKNILLENIEEDKDKYAQQIYSKLPKKAKVFLTKKRIMKILEEFIEISKK